MLSAVKIPRALTLLDDEALGWLPVNIAATAAVIRDAAATTGGNALFVIYILNDADHPTSLDLLRWLERHMNEFRGSPTAPMGSSGLTASLAGGDFHPASPLLDHWKG